MRILVADKFEQSGIDGLTAAGCEVIFQPDLKDAALRDAIASTGAEVLVVRGTSVTAEMLAAGSLALIVRAGAGYNTIDVAEASRRGIYVSNCPGKNAIAVAELAMGLILSLDRRIPDSVAELRAGKWNKKEFSKAHGLYGRTLGLVGYGNIGQEMAKRALGFGLRVVVWSRRFANGAEAPELPVEIAPSLDALAAQADIVSVHCPRDAGTLRLIDAAAIARMKPGAVFISTARGGIHDEPKSLAPRALQRTDKGRKVLAA